MERAPSRGRRWRGPGLLRRLRGRRRLRVTPEGRLYLALTVGIGLAAINTGNNLLYLLLGWLLSLIVASGALSNLALRRLRVARRAPERIHAGTPFSMEISVENGKRRAASWSIQVQDLTGGRAVDKRCAFLKVPAGRTQRAIYRHTFHRRGVYRFDGFRVSTRFPFSLFTKSRELRAPGEVLVYPAIQPVAILPPIAHRVGDVQQSRLGRRGEFFGLREYREGDDRRAIAWRSSARGRRLLVREHEEEAQRRVSLELDNAVSDPSDEAALDRLEAVVSRAASMAVAYLRRGFAVELRARGVRVASAAGAAQERRVLRALALLPATTAATPMAGDVDRQAEVIRVGAAA